MEISVLRLIILNFVRKQLRRIRKNKSKVLIGLIISIILIIYIKELIPIIDLEYIRYVPIVMYIYCVAKIMQDTPIMIIRPELIELKVLTITKFKSLVLIKSILVSIVAISLISLSNFILYGIKETIIVLLLINAITNLACFFIYQVKYPNIFRLFIILSISMIYYLNSINIAIALTVALIAVIIKCRYIKYDSILPYYKSITRLSDSFLGEKVDSVAQERTVINKKASSSLNIMERYYSSNKSFHFYKELSRIINNKKVLINGCLMSFVISILISLYGDNFIIKFIGVEVVLMVCDNILTTLNKAEANNKNSGFFLPYSMKDLIIQKYSIHLLVTVIYFFSGVLLVKYVNFYILGLSIILIPIKSILFSFSNDKITKIAAYLISIIIYSIVFLSVYK